MIHGASALLALVLAFSGTLMASDNDPGNSSNVVRKPVVKLCPDTPDELPLPEQGNIMPRQQPAVEELPSSQPKWGADFLVKEEPFASSGRLSLDHAENGDIFVGSVNPTGSPLDTFHIYKSTDHGENWSVSDYYATNNSGSDSIVDGVIRVGKGTNPWVYMFVHYSTSGGQLWFRRFRADYSAVSSWIQIIRGDSLRGFTVDRNNGDTLFIAMHMPDATGFNTLRIFASYDSGDAWAQVRSVGVSATISSQQTQLTTGGDGNVFISYLFGSVNRIRMRRYTDNLTAATTTIATYLDSMATADTIGMMALAAQRPGHRDSQAVWVLNVHKHAGANSDIHVTYSTDGGQTWSATTEWPFNEPSMNTIAAKFAEDYPAPIVTAAAKSTSGMEMIMGWSQIANPGSWNDKDTINDYQLTGMGSLAPAVDLVLQSAGTQVIYKRYATGSIYTDWWGNNASGVMGEEPARPVAPAEIWAQVRPNPAEGAALLAFTLKRPEPVTAILYKLSGQRVSVLYSGKLPAGKHQIPLNVGGLASGIYFYRIATGSSATNGRLVVMR